MAFTKKEWQDTRPSECKGSGVAEACVNWTKACLKAEKVAADPTAALKAIDEMSRALKTAETKLGACKDKKKVTDTKALITDWRKEMTEYQVALNKAVFALAEAEMKEKKERAEKAVNAILDGHMYTVETTIAKMLDDADTAIKKKDADAAELKLTSAKRKIHDMGTIAKKGIDDPIKVESAREKLPSGTLKGADFKLGLSALRSLLKTQAERAAKIEKAWDELVDGAGPTEPDLSKESAETKKNVETVLKLYRETVKDLADCQKRANVILDNAKKVNGNPLVRSNPTGIVTVITKALDQAAKLREDARQVMYDIRESGGKCVEKRQALFKPDNAKPFVPFLTRGITINGRMIEALSKAEEEFEEALNEIVAGGNPQAVGPAQKLLATL